MNVATRLNELLEKFRNMTPEEYEKLHKSMYEEVSLKKQIFEHFLMELERKRVIDYEDVLYFPEKYCIDMTDLYLIIDYLNYGVQNENFSITSDEKCSFPNYECIFKYQDTFLKLFMISGQGTSYCFHITKPCNDFNELIIDEEIKFKRMRRR